MTAIKRAFITALIVLGATMLAAVGAYWLVDDATLVSVLVKRIETTTKTHISYRSDAGVTRTWAPTLSLSELVIDDAQDRYRVESRSLQVQISLPGMLLGRLDVPRLWIGDTRVHVTEAWASSKPASRKEQETVLNLAALRLRPVLRDVRVSELSILLEGDSLRLPAGRISQLSVALKPGTETPVLTAQLEVQGDTFDISAKLPGLHDALRQQQLPFSVSVLSTIAESSAVGRVDFNRPRAVVQATVRTRLPDLKRIPRTGALELPGELTAEGQLNGPLDQLALEGLSANWTGPGRSMLKLAGRIGHLTQLKDIELNVAGQLDEAAWLTPLLPETIAPLTAAELSAQVSGTPSRISVRQFTLKAKTSDELDLSLTGQFDLAHALGAPQPENIDLELAFRAPTTRAARALLFDEVPEFGAITARTDIHLNRVDPAFDNRHPAFENIVIKTQDEHGIQVDLSGRIAQFPLSPSRPNKGYDLDVTMKANKTSAMTQRFGLDLPLPGPLDIKYRIEGDTQALRLNEIKLSATDNRGTLINAKGRIAFREWDREDPLEAIDLVVDVRARTTRFLSATVKQDLPTLAYVLHARLHTVSGQHRIDDFRLNTAPGEPLVVSETGSAERVTFLPELAIEGIRINSRIRTDDVAMLNKLFQLDNRIPPIGPLEWRATVTGSNTKLFIDDVLLTAGQERVLRLETKGRLGYISAENNWRLENTDLTVNAHSSSSRSLAEALGYRIPRLGPVRMHASINDKHKPLGVEAIQVRVGSMGKPLLHSHGTIGDLYALAKIGLVTELNLGKQTVAALSQRYKLPDLGPVTGRIMISDEDGSLGIDSFDIESTHTELFSLSARGRFDDFRKPQTLVFDTRLTARDMKLIGALLDRDWPDHGAVEFNAQAKSSDRYSGRIDATLTSGKQKIAVALNADFRTHRPQFRGKITAQNFFLPDLAEKQRKKRAEKRQKHTESFEKKPVFSQADLDLNWLKAVDMDLAVDIESFDRAHSAAESAQLTIALASGKLSIDSATVTYPEGEARLNLTVDARDRPKVNFDFVGENLDPWRGLNIYEPDSNGFYEAEDAEADIRVSLRSAGRSRHELASNLEGDLYLAIRNGKISQSQLKLLFADIVGWVSSLKKRRYDDVNCGIADLSMHHGVVSTNAFFIDTQHITIAGEGMIDLGKEQIDYVFIPKKKSRLIVKAEPVKIRGPLNDPSITAIPAKSLAVEAGKFGTLLFAPYVFAGMIAGQYATGAMKARSEDSSACVKYVQTREEAQKRRSN